MSDSSAFPEVMTPEQAAAYLQIHPDTLYRYIREGKITASRLGRSYRLTKTDLLRFLEQTRTRS